MTGQEDGTPTANARDATSHPAPLLARHGPGFERALRILCGVVLFALLASLGDIWGLEGYRLKVAVKNALIEVSAALLGISVALGPRLMLPHVAAAARPILIGSWLLLAVSATGTVIYAAYHLYSGLQAQISNIQAGQHEAILSPTRTSDQRFLDTMRRCLEVRKLRAELGDPASIPGWDRVQKICETDLPRF